MTGRGSADVHAKAPAVAPPTLLVIDDEPSIARFLERFAPGFGFCVEYRGGGRETIPYLEALRPAVALVDLQMPGINGLEMLKAIRAIDSRCQVILMTGHATVDTAIEAVKLGALDYLSKPLPVDRLAQLLRDVRDDIALRRAVLLDDQAAARHSTFCNMIGRSPVMQELFALLRRVAPHIRTALVTGETGVGKELVARALHQLGPRRDKEFVALNCSAVADGLFESELFGHVRGAFTGAFESKKGLFEAADGGTLFLDEIGELPLAMQAKLLRVLEAGEVQPVGSVHAKKVDVRVVAATNRNLREDVTAGLFRRDLLFRLNVIELTIAPLRDRSEDIPYLAATFLGRWRAELRSGVEGISPAAERLLREYPWPGNVRELRNVLERACLLADETILSEREVSRALPPHLVGTLPVARDGGAPADGALNALKRGEFDQIRHALAETHGNKAAAARRLGVSRRLLYRRLEEERVLTRQPAARSGTTERGLHQSETG